MEALASILEGRPVRDVLLLLVALAGWEFYKTVLGIFKGMADRWVFRRKRDWQSLAGNQFFAQARNWLHLGIDAIPFSDRGRGMMMKDMLRILVQAFYDNFDKFVKDKTLWEEVDQQKMISEVLRLVGSCMHTFEMESAANKISPILVERFRSWNSRTTEFVVTGVTQISNSSYFYDNQQKMHSILTLLTACLEMTITDAERTINNLNGELDGFMYRGIICEKATH